MENYFDNYVNESNFDSPPIFELRFSYNKRDNEVSKYFFLPNTFIGPVSWAEF